MQKQHGGDPATIHYTITPSATPLTQIPRFIYVAADGDLQMTDSSNTTVTIPVTAGQLLPFRPTVVGTSTTATVIAWL